MRIETYNYILNTLLRVAPFFAGAILDEAIKKTGHTVDTISAGEMLKIIKAEVLPKLSEDKDVITDSLILANTSTIQTDIENNIVHIDGPFSNRVEESCTFESMKKNGFVEEIKNLSTTKVREIVINENIFRVSISPIFDKNKVITGALSTVSNLTLQREIEDEIVSYSENLRKEIDARIDAEDELKQNQTLLFHSSKLVALGEMASGIAHEINNPLASLKLSVTLIKKLREKEKLTDRKLEEEFKSQLELIDRMSNTINSMRKLSRPSSTDDFRHVSLRQIIKDVMVLSGEKLIINDVDVRIDPSKADIDIFCQETQIGQVIINLINNAFDEIVDQFQEPWIEIDWHQAVDNTYITITDCGHGIPMEKADKIFNPFYTGKISRGGTGLGLSISNQILKAHQGHLYIDNDHPNTRFVLSIPNKTGAHNG